MPDAVDQSNIQAQIPVKRTKTRHPQPPPPGKSKKSSKSKKRQEEPPAPTGEAMIGRIPVLDIRPLVDCGRRPAKAVAGETLQVTATVFREGHDAVAANVVLRDPAGRSGPWTPMRELAPGTDRWGAEVTPASEGRWTYTVEAWSDPLATWRHNAGIKIPAGMDTELVLAEGAELYERAAAGVPKKHGRAVVLAAVDVLRDETRPPSARHAAVIAPEVDRILARYPLRELVSASRPAALMVERKRALFGSWYEFFPAPRARSWTRAASSRRSPAPSAPPPSGCRPSPRWASTSSTCRRFTRSGQPSARAPTTR